MKLSLTLMPLYAQTAISEKMGYFSGSQSAGRKPQGGCIIISGGHCIVVEKKMKYWPWNESQEAAFSVICPLKTFDVQDKHSKIQKYSWP